MDDTVTVSVADLDALIEKRLAQREAAARQAVQDARKGLTPGCNCNAEGYRDRAVHQFGCPYGGQKPLPAGL